MPRVQILSTVRNGPTTYHANTFTDLSDDELAALPPGTFRVMANETEEKSRRAAMMNPASSVEDRLVGRVFTGLPGGGGDPPWAQPSDSPIDVYDPETGRPYPDDHEEAREARDKSIIERQAKGDLRAPGVIAIEPEQPGAKGEKTDKKAAKAAEEQQNAAKEAFEERAKRAAPPPANVQAGPGAGIGGATVVTTIPTPQGPKPPEKGQTSADAGKKS